MKPYIQPAPDDQPQPAEQPAPAKQPRRRTFTQPTFGTSATRTVKSIAALFLAASLSAAQAQTKPVPDPPSPPGVPTRPLNPDDRRPPQTPPQQPVTPHAGANDGWIMFDDRSTLDLDLRDDQLQHLRDMDGRYQKDYTALGNTPSENPSYRSLSDRRNAEVKGILSPDQYERWMNIRPTPDERMDRDAPGGMKKDGTSAPRKATPGTVKPKVDPATTPVPKTSPKN